MYKINKIGLSIIMSVVIIFSSQISNAKYIKTEIIKGKQEIATPIIKIKEGDYINIDNVNRIGEYEFSIENFNDENISEINLFYTIEILTNSDIEKNAKFELYNDEEKVELINLKTEPILINGNQKIGHKYNLKMDYSEADEYQNISGKIQIKINVEQEQL